MKAKVGDERFEMRDAPLERKGALGISDN